MKYTSVLIFIMGFHIIHFVTFCQRLYDVYSRSVIALVFTATQHMPVKISNVSTSVRFNNESNQTLPVFQIR